MKCIIVWHLWHLGYPWGKAYLSSWIQVRRTSSGFLTTLLRPPSFSFLSHCGASLSSFHPPVNSLCFTPQSPTNHSQLNSAVLRWPLLEPTVTTPASTVANPPLNGDYEPGIRRPNRSVPDRSFLPRFTARFVAAKLHFYGPVTSQ